MALRHGPLTGFKRDADGSARLVCAPQLEAHIYMALLPHSLDVLRGAGAVRCPVIAASGCAYDAIHGCIAALMPDLVEKLPLGRLER